MFAGIFSRLFRRLLHGEAGQSADTAGFEALNRHAPVRNAAATPGAAGAGAALPEGFICREPILAPDQRVAGYQFMLHEGTRHRIRSRSRRIHHVYAEVLVRNLAQLRLDALLGHRQAFLDIPDSFVDHPSIADLPAASVVLVVTPLDEDGAPPPRALLESVRRQRAHGLRVAVACDDLLDRLAFLAPEADYAVLAVDDADPAALKETVQRLRRAGCAAPLVARDLPTQDDFQLARALGAALFQGPFITSREDWHGNRLGPNSARLAELLARLRRDADTGELVELLKQDGALSLRLMRYINSAALGLQAEVSSIERALLQLGRDRLYRWLMLLMYGADKPTARTAALLENALVRARLLELLGDGRPPPERDALFLVGLLSLVDAVLQVPMAEAMASLAVAPEIEAAVLHGEGPMAALLALAVACEQGGGDRLETVSRECGIPPALATRRHLEAFTWALELNA